MIDEREIVRRAVETLTPPEPSLDRLVHRRERVVRNRRIRAGVLGVAVAIAAGWLAFDAIHSAQIPADDRSEELGMFAPVAGRIVYVNDEAGYGRGVWAVDPNGPSDTTPGPGVADDVVSTLVRLGPEDAIPLDWSSDGTELLFKRSSGRLFPREFLYILHADGSETEVTSEPMRFGGATIAPDGSRVVFARWEEDLGLYAVDAEGGTPERLLPGPEDALVSEPTYSRDGTKIAYVVENDDGLHVWVMDADGSDPHPIVANPTTLDGVTLSLDWSPTGEKIALGLLRSDGLYGIYTFAPDGSGFTQVITGGSSPRWSPDGSQIAYTISSIDPQGLVESAGLAIADADGSNVREFGFAASGPWHPGVSGADEPAPSKTENGDLAVLHTDGEVLNVTGLPSEAAGEMRVMGRSG